MAEKIPISITLLLCFGLQYFTTTTSVYPPETTADVEYNKNHVIQEVRPHALALEFLATCQGANFYSNNLLANQNASRASCQSFGMRLATFSSHLQLQCVTLALPNNSSAAWTDGVSMLSPRSFQSGGAYVANDLPISFIPGQEQLCGLMLNYKDTSPRLTSLFAEQIMNSICML